jgi:hypothetical protein
MTVSKWRKSIKPRVRRPLPPELREALTYDPQTGHLYWKQSPWSSTARNVRAGCLMGSGYIVIGFKGQNYYAHRVAWFVQTGDDPALPIDHADGAKANNRWANLRLATNSQNAANRPARARRLKGVSQSGERFTATIGYQGRAQHIGTFDTADEAHAAYLAKAKELFGEFARAA